EGRPTIALPSYGGWRPAAGSGLWGLRDARRSSRLYAGRVVGGDGRARGAGRLLVSCPWACARAGMAEQLPLPPPAARAGPPPLPAGLGRALPQLVAAWAAAAAARRHLSLLARTVRALSAQ